MIKKGMYKKLKKMDKIFIINNDLAVEEVTVWSIQENQLSANGRDMINYFTGADKHKYNPSRRHSIHRTGNCFLTKEEASETLHDFCLKNLEKYQKAALNSLHNQKNMI